MLNKRILVLIFVVAFLTLLIGCFPSPAPPIEENQAPEITSTPNLTAIVGVTYVYDVEATDPDGDALTYSLAPKPPNMNISSASGLIWWTPKAEGKYTVIVKVSDGVLYDTQSFNIVVSEPTVPVVTYTITASAGTGGTISPLGDVTVDEGKDISFYIFPNANYGIDKVLVDGGSVGAVSTYPFINVAKDHTIHAIFKAVEPEPEIELTGIVVDPKTMDLVVGKSKPIKSVTATYEIRRSKVPIALGECDYTSSATGIATVSDTGLVKAIKVGTATITVSYREEITKTVYIEKTDTLVVTVSAVELDHIIVLPETMDLFVGESGFITSVTAYYNDGTDNLPDNWTYGLNPVGKVSVNVVTGEVTAIAGGETTITVNYEEGGITKTDTIIVTVEVFPYSFENTQDVNDGTVGHLVTTVTEDGDWMVWTFDFPVEEFTGEGNLSVGLIIALDGEGNGPAYQIHNNDGTDATYPWGTWLMSPWGPTIGDGWMGWHSGDTNTPVTSLSWVEAIGQRNTPWEGIVSGDGVMEIRIKKSELGNAFHWAASPTVGSGFYTPAYDVTMQIPAGFDWGTPLVTMSIPNYIAR